MSGPSDPLTGVKCFTIGGRMVERRQRCLGMTDDERKWRAQWLKDQVLDPEEPRFVPEYYKQTNNIFRRLYKTPMSKLQSALEPIVGYNKAFYIRHTIGKGFLFLASAYVLTYFFKYHTNQFNYPYEDEKGFDWTQTSKGLIKKKNLPKRGSLAEYPFTLCVDNAQKFGFFGHFRLYFQTQYTTATLQLWPCGPKNVDVKLSADFTASRSVELFKRSIMYPDDKNYPNIPQKKNPSEYYDEKFYSSVLCKNIKEK